MLVAIATNNFATNTCFHVRYTEVCVLGSGASCRVLKVKSNATGAYHALKLMDIDYHELAEVEVRATTNESLDVEQDVSSTCKCRISHLCKDFFVNQVEASPYPEVSWPLEYRK